MKNFLLSLQNLVYCKINMLWRLLRFFEEKKNKKKKCKMYLAREESDRNKNRRRKESIMHDVCVLCILNALNSSVCMICTIIATVEWNALKCVCCSACICRPRWWQIRAIMCEYRAVVGSFKRSYFRLSRRTNLFIWYYI